VKRLALTLTAAVLLGIPSAAAASPTAPFGHACTPQDAVRFCPTASDAQRIPSFDGLPLDVDVTLPEGGTAPYPTILMLHGFPGTKGSFEASTPEGPNPHMYHWNNVFFAQQGYAVINVSSRGFGRSCGVPDSRTSPMCDRGWFHPVADQRWELHDFQLLLGLLVDEGVTDADRIGVTGTSMGGLASMQLAFLRNRVRDVNGALSLWSSPAGKPLSIAAAYPRWGASDLAYSLIPNGRALDFAVPPRPESIDPIGVQKASVMNILAAGGAAAGFVAPKGADPTADLLGWTELVGAGEPYGSAATKLARQVTTFKSSTRLPITATPLLIQMGWTDPVFPAIEAVRPYNQQLVGGRNDVALQLGDIGHFTGGNPLGQYMRFNDDGAAFFRRHLQGTAAAAGPAPGSVTAFLQGCPKGSKGSGAIVAPEYSSLARGSLLLPVRSGLVSSSGGSDSSAKVVDPVATSDRCTPAEPGSSKGTLVLTAKSPGFTMLGLPTIQARVRTKGKYGQLDAVLWEVLDDGTQRVVDFGVFRLTKDQTGLITFQLHGNGYRFAKGSTVKLELRGRTPNLYRPSNGKFSVRLTDVFADLPTRDRPGSKKGIVQRLSHLR
jgi:pimeloyl-ACP methyl ester carboxylesterase